MRIVKEDDIPIGVSFEVRIPLEHKILYTHTITAKYYEALREEDRTLLMKDALKDRFQHEITKKLVEDVRAMIDIEFEREWQKLRKVFPEPKPDKDWASMLEEIKDLLK